MADHQEYGDVLTNLLDQSELWRDEADHSGGDQNIQTTVTSEQTTQNTVTSG